MSAHAAAPGGPYCVVLTTTRDEAQAGSLAAGIVAARLGACVQMLPARSLYTWNGEACDHAEVLLLIKTRLDRYDALEAFVRANHTDETPEILALTVARGSPDYLAWIDQGTGA